MKYIDPDGRQPQGVPYNSPSMGNTRTGPMQYPPGRYLQAHLDNSENLADFMDYIMSQNPGAGAVAMWDRLFGGRSIERKLKQMNIRMMDFFFKIQYEVKTSGLFDTDKDGAYSMAEAKEFAIYVNSQVNFTYASVRKVGPYMLRVPRINLTEAYDYLNGITDRILKEISIKKATPVVE